MKRSEIFDILLDRICEECEVSREKVISGRKMQPVVEARTLLVQYLRRIGLTNDDIALIMLRKERGDMSYDPSESEWTNKSKAVDKTFKSYSDRCMQSYAFCLMSKAIKNFCHEQYKELYVHGMKEIPN